MRRVASHYVYWNGLFRMHYVELDDEGCLAGVYPLEGEIAGTEFYDGVLFPVVDAGEEFHADKTKVPCRGNKSSMPKKPEGRLQLPFQFLHRTIAPKTVRETRAVA